MKWWHVLIVSIAYPFLLGNIRVYRFENHQKPILVFSTVNLFFTGTFLLIRLANLLTFCDKAFSVVVYIFILYEIFCHFLSDQFLACHRSDQVPQEKGMRVCNNSAI